MKGQKIWKKIKEIPARIEKFEVRRSQGETFTNPQTETTDLWMVYESPFSMGTCSTALKVQQFFMYKAVSNLIMVHTLWLDGNFQPFFGIN